MSDDRPPTDESDDGVLSPTQLDPDDEHIERLDDHRYVVTLDATEDEAENDGVAGASSSDTSTGEDHDSGNREDYDSGNADDHDPSGGAVPPGADGDTDRRVGLRGLIGAFRNDDVQRSLGLLVEAAERIGATRGPERRE